MKNGIGRAAAWEREVDMVRSHRRTMRMTMRSRKDEEVSVICD